MTNRERLIAALHMQCTKAEGIHEGAKRALDAFNEIAVPHLPSDQILRGHLEDVVRKAVLEHERAVDELVEEVRRALVLEREARRLVDAAHVPWSGFDPFGLRS